MALFRRAETGPEPPRLTGEILDELKYLRGRVESLESSWADTRDQIRRSYQRLEKAAERAAKAQEEDCGCDDQAQEIPDGVVPAARSFAEKLKAVRG